MSMPCGAKKFFAAICFGFLIILCQTLTARALETETDDAALMQQLYSDSGADRLEGALPDYAAGLLDDLGLDGFYPGGVDNVTLGSITAVLRGVISENLREPLRVLCCLVGIVILSAALDAVKSGGAADGALTVVSTLCAVSIIAPPILELTGDLAGTIEASSDFMLLYVPVISGLMIASGSAAGGSMYCGVMVFVAAAVTRITSQLVLPLLKCVMSLSVVASSCEKVRFDGVVELFRKAARFILTFCMSLFVAFLTMRSIVSAAADSLANRAVKFAVSSFVPLVGGALSDAYQTVISCVTVLKSGVGAAAIAAVFVIFVPVAVRCALWQAVTSVGAALCGLFDLGRVSSLLSSLSSVVSVVLAVLLCTMVIYIISTAIVIIVGG